MAKKTKNKLIIFCLITLLIFPAVPYMSEASLVGNTNNATLSLSSNTGTYKVGSTYSVDILVNTHGQNVVAVAAYLNYNPSLFQVVSVDTSGSILTSEARNVVDNVNGKIEIVRGIPTPGINTTNGKVATLNMQGLSDSAPSTDNFSFDFTAGSTNESNIILNDGLGTDIISGVDNGRYALDGTPPMNVSSFTATAGNSQVSLNWTNPGADFSGVTILRKTGSYPASPTDGTVVYDNIGTSYNNTGLTNGVTYYYKAFSHDALLNYASGSQASATPSDSISPAPITTLSAVPINARSMTLNWTAVGDNGNSGTAASYDARYSTSAITAANFSLATQATGEPSPKANGGAESMTLTGLTGATTYYFAIKAIDASGNTGAISNLPSAKTYKSADLNNDNLVNSVDFGMLMSFWNYTTRPIADINQDGYVNSVDFGMMMSQWG
ncbi:MAG: cohesin domain-containing protein [Candidatus Paceibacterota bacterium]|jgi:hypothetical protein